MESDTRSNIRLPHSISWIGNIRELSGRRAQSLAKLRAEMFSGFFLAAVLSLLLVQSVLAQGGTARFAVIGDYGDDSDEEEDVADLVKSLNPDFIITTGDNNYPDGEASTIDRNIGQYYHEFIFPYRGNYGPGASTNRFFPSLGNHDWHTPGVRPYLDYFTLPGNERYYEFVWGPVHLFAIDSDVDEPDGRTASSDQAEWLRRALAASNAPWKIVYFHHPPYSSGRHGSTTAMRWPFREWGATATIAGHDHVYERLIINDFPYFTNGLGGTSRYAFEEILSGSRVRYNADYGAMLVNANDSSITFQFINREGDVIDTFVLGSSGPVLAAPSNLTASAVAGSQINLRWNDNSGIETSYSIERCQGVNCTNFSVIGQVGANVTAFTDPGLDQASYGYRVRATSGSGFSTYSNIARASTVVTGAVFSDDFEDGTRDSSKWKKGLFSRSSSIFDPDMFVSEQNGVLRIKPTAGVSEVNASGLVTVSNWNLTGLAASVEASKSSDNNTVAIFSVGINTDNWYSFRLRGDSLMMEAREDGVTVRKIIDYSSSQHAFWRIRHDTASDRILFETSDDGSDWIQSGSITRGIDITSVKIELIAGTAEVLSIPGAVEYDNFRLAP